MDDLISEFIEETADSLAALDRDLATLQQRPDDKPSLGNLYRFAHTIKSTCGFLGLPRLEVIAEASELLLAKLRDGAIPSNNEAVALIAETIARMRSLIAHLAEEGAEQKGEDSDLIERFTHFAIKQRSTPAPKPEPKPVVVSKPVVAEIAAPTLAPTPVAEAADAAMLDAWMHMVGDLIQTRNQLQHVLGKDAKASAPLQQLSSITNDLRESVTKARATARSNTPELTIATLLLLEAAGRIFALPQQHIVEVIHLQTNADARIDTQDENATLEVRGRRVPLMRLSDLMELTVPSPITARETKGHAIVVRAETSDVALLVDDVRGTTETVVRSMSRLLANVAAYAGVSILGDDSLALVLDADGIAARFGARKLDTKRIGEPFNQPVALTSFLVFHAGNAAPKAVPLERVLRIAMVNAANVTDGVAMQDEQAIELRALPNSSIPQHGEFNIIMAQNAERTIGLVVDKVIDIMDAPLVFPSASYKAHYLGSTLIAGAITEVVDMDHLLQHAAAEASA